MSPNAVDRESLLLGMNKRATRASSSNFSTQLRLAQTKNAGSLAVPALVADNTQTHDSEQIRAATIAHHI